ncbi:dihydrofolate reductase family protein [Brachybacterium muris]
MARLIYSVIASLDGYSADATGDFQWAAPDEEVHLAINEEMAQVGTYLHGRRMYETMAVWETDPSFAQGSPAATAFVPL